jgi:hypothetical protein
LHVVGAPAKTSVEVAHAIDAARTRSIEQRSPTPLCGRPEQRVGHKGGRTGHVASSPGHPRTGRWTSSGDQTTRSYVAVRRSRHGRPEPCVWVDRRGRLRIRDRDPCCVRARVALASGEESRSKDRMFAIPRKGIDGVPHLVILGLEGDSGRGSTLRPERTTPVSRRPQ